MLKSIAAAAAIAAMSAAPAMADLSKKHGRASQMKVGSSEMLPPDGYSGQWWTAPNKCEYSRSGRPGETVWFLIINTAHSGCEAYMVQKGFADAY